MYMLCSRIAESLRGFEGYSVAKKILGDAPLTPDRLREVILAGDPIVDEHVRNAVDDVASVLVGAVNLLTPSLVIVGGGLPRYFPEIVGELERRVLAACLPPPTVEQARFLSDCTGKLREMAASAREMFPPSRSPAQLLEEGCRNADFVFIRSNRNRIR